MSRTPPIRLELPRRENRYAFKRTMDREAFSKELARQIKRLGRISRFDPELRRRLRIVSVPPKRVGDGG